LFLGIELVAEHLRPLAEKTAYVVNRMKEFGILMSSNGPNHNVIKIKPPLTFTIENAREVLFYLHKIFGEDFMKII
jgi:4-aminobutyrate aminotransferase-like enzyme